MIQKEVAERIDSEPNCKAYGAFSVLVQYYCDTEYEATTTITSVNGEDNPTKCTTTTIVTDIDGYLDNTYTEVRTYEKGKGLIFFSVSTSLDGSFPYAVFENNLFTYILDKYIEK